MDRGEGTGGRGIAMGEPAPGEGFSSAGRQTPFPGRDV